MSDIELVRSNIRVKASSIQGYGVFAAEVIKKGQIIEECYTLFSHSKDFSDYVFECNGMTALALGYGGIYNHSTSPNAAFRFDTKRMTTTFYALKDINADEEITISYGKDWFSNRNLNVIAPFKYRYRRAISFMKMLMRGMVVVLLVYLATKYL